MRSKTATPKAAPKPHPSAPFPPPRRGVALALGLITLLALGFAFWSWHQSRRPGAAHLQAGLDAQAAHQDAQAEQEWLLGTREDPSYPDDYAQLGDLYLSRQRFDEAVTQYQAAARLSPRDGTLYLRLTRAQLGAHQPVEALASAQKAMDLRPDDPDAAGVCGIIAAGVKNRPVALVALRRAHQLKPNDEDWTLELARQEIDSVQLAEAERDLSSYLKDRPGDGEANRLLALLYKQKPPTPENVRAGLALAERACREAPNDANTFLLLGQLRLSAGQVPEALRAFQTAQSLHPYAAEILSGLVTCYSRLHDTAHAAQAANALQIIDARLDRIEHLKTAILLRPADLASRLELARLEEDSGDVPAAQDNYAKAASQAPDDPRVRAALKALRLRHPDDQAKAH